MRGVDLGDAGVRAGGPEALELGRVEQHLGAGRDLGGDQRRRGPAGELTGECYAAAGAPFAARPSRIAEMRKKIAPGMA